MSGFASVRAAVVSTFTAPPIANLMAVFNTDPIMERPADPWPAEDSTLAWGWVSILHSTEERASFPTGYGVAGAGGFKEVGYEVRLAFELQNLSSREDAVADQDRLVDAVTARLRSKPQLDGSVFSAGEGAGALGAGRVTWTVNDPWSETFSGGRLVTIWSEMTFTVVEMVQV